MAVSDTSIYTISAFDLSYALAGGLLFAKDSNNVYHYVSGFVLGSVDVLFPYKAKVEGVEFFFNEFGKSVEEVYSLYSVNNTSPAAIDAGTLAGNVYYFYDASTQTTIRFNMSKLTYKEQVALRALHALIRNFPQYDTFSQQRIRLFVQKAFEFANEFFHQAIDVRRTSNDVMHEPESSSEQSENSSSNNNSGGGGGGQGGNPDINEGNSEIPEGNSEDPEGGGNDNPNETGD